MGREEAGSCSRDYLQVDQRYAGHRASSEIYEGGAGQTTNQASRI